MLWGGLGCPQMLTEQPCRENAQSELLQSFLNNDTTPQKKILSTILLV